MTARMIMQASLVLADAGVGQSGLAIILGLVVGAGIAMLFIGLQRVIDGQTTSMARRLDDFVNFNVAAPPEQQARRQRRRSRNPQYAFDKSSNDRSWSVNMARELARADLKLTV